MVCIDMYCLQQGSPLFSERPGKQQGQVIQVHNLAILII